MADPVIAQKGPYEVELLGSYRYAWCQCGLSNYQPFCDGSHTNAPPIQPVIWTEKRDRKAYLCGCKQSKNKPFCDDTHNTL